MLTLRVFAGNSHKGLGVDQPHAVDILNVEYKPVVRARVITFHRGKQTALR